MSAWVPRSQRDAHQPIFCCIPRPPLQRAQQRAWQSLAESRHQYMSWRLINLHEYPDCRFLVHLLFTRQRGTAFPSHLVVVPCRWWALLHGCHVAVSSSRQLL